MLFMIICEHFGCTSATTVWTNLKVKELREPDGEPGGCDRVGGERQSEPNPCDLAGGHGDGKDRLGEAGWLGGKRHSKTERGGTLRLGFQRLEGFRARECLDYLQLGPIRDWWLGDPAAIGRSPPH